MFKKNMPAWRKAQFDAERAYARQIIAAPRGSKERRDLYVHAYSDVIGNIIEKNFPGGGESHTPVLTAALVEGLIEESGSVLDMGCGSGGLLAELLQRGYDAYGIDASADSIRRAEQRIAHLQISHDHVSLGEFTTYEPGRTFDCLVMDNVIEHIAPDEVYDTLMHCKRLLNPGGALLIITPHRFSGPHDVTRLFLPLGSLPQGFHLKEYTCTGLAEVLTHAQFSRVFGYALHPKLTRFLPIRPAASRLALQKALRCEQLFSQFPFSLLLKMHRVISQVFVATLFPTVLVARKAS